MARKQMGMFDEDWLARVDARAAELGQTRRLFVERAVEVALGGPVGSARPASGGGVVRERAVSTAVGSSGEGTPLPKVAPRRV